ncbi:hypothetical protein LWI29_024447 [Acer saccharum]|uniref:Uncharacterized protein n=1 Tax=Acer saccharum TaxID=4024 RepID=A0AA39T5U7_ACESA|nr:hypothetical protein LWI29_024447 [Acer saccharum]
MMEMMGMARGWDSSVGGWNAGATSWDVRAGGWDVGATGWNVSTAGWDAYTVKVEEEASSVEVEGLRKKHVLDSRNECWKSVPEKDKLHTSWPKEVSEVMSSQVGMVEVYEGEACQGSRAKKTATGKVIGRHRLARKSRGVVLKKNTDKGKRKWCKRQVVRPRASVVQNGNLILEKRKGSDLAECVRVFESSS